MIPNYERRVFYVGGHPPGVIPSALNHYIVNSAPRKSWDTVKKSIAERKAIISSDLKITVANGNNDIPYENNAWSKSPIASSHLVVVKGPHNYVFITPGIEVGGGFNFAEYPDPFELAGSGGLDISGSSALFFLDPVFKTLGKIEGTEAQVASNHHPDSYETFRGAAVTVPTLKLMKESAEPAILRRQINYRNHEKDPERIWVSTSPDIRFVTQITLQPSPPSP